jgi:hypothetical protein
MPRKGGFFKPGNTYGKGRPRVSLSKPDILLPAIFNKAKVNWASDFTKLYKIKRMRAFTAEEKDTFRMLLDLLPYLIVKPALNGDELKKYLDKGAAEKMAHSTAALIRSLEQESHAAKPTTDRPGEENGLADGGSPLPPQA